MEKTRAVAYIRVSTEKDKQLHSYEFQEHYWNTIFQDDPTIDFVGIYADKGISGHNAQKRPNFLLMMEDAREHKFDRIYTKSVARFARNTVQLLQAVRELRDLDIEVIFENEGIRSFQSTSEVYLTLAATIAENDLEVDAERMRWSYRHRFENGWITVGTGLYGLRMTPENTLEIVPEEAAIVKYIFETYISGLGSTVIAKKLNEAGVKTREQLDWTPAHIVRVLRNEKYKGDSIMGKTVRHLGEYHKNSDGKHGPLYTIKNTHEPIVDESTWELAQAILSKRSKRYKPTPVYEFTKMIECGCCGAGFRHKVNGCGLKWQSNIWACNRKLDHGAHACGNSRIKDSVLKEKFVEAYNEFVQNRPIGESLTEAQEFLSDLQDQLRELAVLEIKHLISQKDFEMEKKAIREQMAAVQDRITKRRLNRVPEKAHTSITGFDEEKLKQFITKVIVKNFTVTFVFYNEAKITLKYDNGQAGNLPGLINWKKENA